MFPRDNLYSFLWTGVRCCHGGNVGEKEGMGLSASQPLPLYYPPGMPSQARRTVVQMPRQTFLSLIFALPVAVLTTRMFAQHRECNVTPA